MTRQQKTPRQRAEEQLGIASRKHDRAHAEVKRLKAQLATAEATLNETRLRRQYAAEDPALTPNASTTTSTTSTPDRSTTP